MDMMKRSRIATRRGVLFLFTLVFLSVLLAISSVWAANVESTERVIIGAGQVINDDLYLAGETVIIDGTVKGDAVLAGRQVTVNGTVEGDLIAAGQVVSINGTVGDDVRIAGQALILDNKARVADDVMAAGLSLENRAGSAVGGDLNFFGAQALLAGTVKQNVVGGMNSLELRGAIGRNMQVTAVGEQQLRQIPFTPKPPVEIPQVEPGLTLTDSARIGGKLTYKSIGNAQISQGSQVAGGVVGEELEHRVALSPNPDQVVIQQLQRLAALVLVGWLLLRFVPAWTQNLAATVQARPLPSLGWGIVTFLAVGVLALAIALVTFILTALFAFTIPSLILPAIALGTLANLTLSIGFVIFASYVPQITLSFLGGRWLLQKLQPDKTSGRFVALIVGLVVFAILTAIPVLGDILNLVIVFLGLGALWLWGRTKLERVPLDRQLTKV